MPRVRDGGGKEDGNMRRRLFSIATVLSALLCVAATALWIWSYPKSAAGVDASLNTERLASRASLIFVAGRGSYWLFWFWAPRHDSKPEYIELTVDNNLIDPPTGKRRLGFGYEYEYFWWSGERRVGILMPCWPVSTAFAILPLLWVLEVFRGMRRRRNICRECSYDLTGNVSGVCPECGKVVAGDARSRKGDGWFVVRGMWRRSLALGSAVSLLLCAATVVMWVRSYKYVDQLGTDVGGNGVLDSSRFIVASGGSRVVLIWHIVPPEWKGSLTDFLPLGAHLAERLQGPPPQKELYAWAPGVSYYWREPLAVRDQSRAAHDELEPPRPGMPLPATTVVKLVGSQGGRSIAISYWLITLVFLVVPVMQLVSIRRRLRRKRQGQRRRFTVVSAFSLLLFAGAAALWARSHFKADAVVWTHGDPDGDCLIFCAAEGRIAIVHSIRPLYQLSDFRRHEEPVFYACLGSPRDTFAPANETLWNRTGFSAWEGGVYSGVTFPIAVPTLLLAVLPVVWVLRTKAQSTATAQSVFTTSRATLAAFARNAAGQSADNSHEEDSIDRHLTRSHAGQISLHFVARVSNPWTRGIRRPPGFSVGKPVSWRAGG